MPQSVFDAPRRLRPLAVTVSSIALAAGAALGLVGCGDSGGGGASADRDGEPRMTEENFVVAKNEPGVPLDPEAVAEFIEVTPDLGFFQNINAVSDFRLTDAPPKLIEGHQTFKGAQYVKSRKLRVEDIYEPSGTKIVQVDVSLGGPLPLPSIPSVERGQFKPGPVLHDDIDNVYYPVGYILSPEGAGRGGEFEVLIDPSDPIKDLNDVPPLSRSRPETLRLLFRVNDGVKVTGFSYGGYDKRTFELQVGEARKDDRG